MEDMSGEEEGSYSSRMSNKSEKNMADFDGEESGCEDELVQLAAQAQVCNVLDSKTYNYCSIAMHGKNSVLYLLQILNFTSNIKYQFLQHYGNMAAAFHSRFHPSRPALLLEASRVFAQFSVDAVCRPGNTLLWDLLQDDKIVSDLL